jgi:hypothetical protein
MTTIVYGERNPRYISSLGGRWVPSKNWAGSTTATLTANRLYYIYYDPDYDKDMNAIGVRVQTAAGTNMRLGLYEIDTDGNPGDLIVTSGDLDPSTTGPKSDAITAQVFDRNYYIGIVSNGATAVRANTATQTGVPTLGADAASHLLGGLLYEDLGVWTALPATAAAVPTYDGTIDLPRVMLYAA